MAFLDHGSNTRRLKEFPRGLGKGFDAALIGAWLQRVVEDVTEDNTKIPDTGLDNYEVLVLFFCESTH